jgi:Methylase involved in ubiquinone/menaquinone biosynthesis
MDPLWSNLTFADKRGNRWQVEEFFLTGEQEIQEVMAFVASLGVELKRGKALDFGCGVGRLSQALAARFDAVWGIDIAPSMIELADRYNRHQETCRYVVNDRTDLRMFKDEIFDFIYSNIAFQHMEPRHQKRYMGELVRVLAPQGLFVFQLPSEPIPSTTDEATERGLKQRVKSVTPAVGLVAYRFALAPYRWVRRELVELGRGPRMEMWGLPREEVIAYIGKSGAKVLSVTPDTKATGWRGFRYAVTK